jgi:hypothetical protein
VLPLFIHFRKKAKIKSFGTARFPPLFPRFQKISYFREFCKNRMHSDLLLSENFTVPGFILMNIGLTQLKYNLNAVSLRLPSLREGQGEGEKSG